MFRFDCEKCGKRIKAPDDAVGKIATCPKCGFKFMVPAIEPPEDVKVVEFEAEADPVLLEEYAEPPRSKLASRLDDEDDSPVLRRRKAAKRSRTKTIAIACSIAGVLIVAAAILVVLKPRSRDGAAAVDAGDAGSLQYEYRTNEAACDTKFTGRLVRVSGWIHSVKKSGSEYEVGFGPNGGTTEIYGGPPATVALFPSSSASELGSLKPLDYITVVGYCEGLKRSPRAFRGQVVIISDCWIEKSANSTKGATR